MSKPTAFTKRSKLEAYLRNHPDKWFDAAALADLVQSSEEYVRAVLSELVLNSRLERQTPPKNTGRSKWKWKNTQGAKQQ